MSTDLFGNPAQTERQRSRTICGCYVDNQSEALAKQKRIERYLLSGKSLTVLDCFKLFRTFELRKILCNLKKTHKIESEWLFSADRKSHFKKYWINLKTENHE